MEKPEPTVWAKIFKNLLERKGLHVEEEVDDGYKHIDLSIPSAKLDIEIDGLQHLTDPNQIQKDFKRSNYSREDGFETLHIHNIDLGYDKEGIASAVAKVAEEREEGINVMADTRKEEVYEGLTYVVEESK